MPDQRAVALSDLTHGLRKAWPAVEASFLACADIPEFRTFLASYAGLPTQRQPLIGDAQRRAMGQTLLDALAGVFTSCNSAMDLVRSGAEGLDDLCAGFEEAINLALLYWYGLGDRNFQYRTVVHFLGLSGQAAPLFEHAGEQHFLFLTEDGVIVGSDASGVPRCAPMARAFGLAEFPPGALAPDKVRGLFSRVRTVQRELCLLVDEWEHRNTLLAVMFNQIRQRVEQATSSTSEQAFEIFTKRMERFRNHLAKWCLSTHVPVQRWLSGWLTVPGLPEDIRLELDAAEAVLLSGLQKVFLPASVSRHRYDNTVVQLVADWCQARLSSRPDDLSTRLLRASVECAAGRADENLLRSTMEFLDQRSFNWTLDYDPCTGLKAFSWCYEHRFHLWLSMLATLAFGRKVHPSGIDEVSLVTLATLYQMPETFPPGRTGEIVVPALSDDLLRRLAPGAAEIIRFHASDELARECVEFVEAELEPWVGEKP